MLQLLKFLVHNLFVYGVICSSSYETASTEAAVREGNCTIQYRECVYKILCHDILHSQFTGNQYYIAALNCDQKYIQVQ